MSIQSLTFEQKQHFVGILETICQELEISESRYTEAKSRYETIGNWLADSEDFRLIFSTIYPQGSIKLGTTVKPIGRDEFDVDLVFYLKFVGCETNPRDINKLVGDRLRENATYSEMMEPLKRGWRISYANKFHLDITPSIKNPLCQNGGELVPDRKVQDWKPSNPIGYAKWFEEHAALRPTLTSVFAARAEVIPFPTPSRFKGVLKRAVQIFKRHRDLFFFQKDASLKPISIILTTLAAKSYRYCIEKKYYNSELDLLMDILRHMDGFIGITERNGSFVYVVPNETTSGENFAEKWNDNPMLADAFYDWHGNALSTLTNLWPSAGSGLDVVAARLSGSFGENVVRKALGSYTKAVDTARLDGQLRALPTMGLSTIGGIHVPRNTFFGR